MTPRDLAYWLQGYFEIHLTGYPPEYKYPDLNNSQIECIERHIQLTISDSGSSYFTSSLLASPFSAWQTLVSSYFEHVLDKNHPEPEKAQAIHDKPLYPQGVRC